MIKIYILTEEEKLSILVTDGLLFKLRKYKVLF